MSLFSANHVNKGVTLLASRCGSIGIPNVTMKDRLTQKPLTLSDEQYKPTGVANKKVEEFFPKALTRIDLDGMEFPATNHQALTYGGMEAKEGEVCMDYMGCIRQPHPLWSSSECENVQITHLKPKGVSARLAWSLVWTLRRVFDIGTGYSFGYRNEKNIIRRICILETVAGIPGMVGGAARHFRSLRTGSRDYGWIHSLLEEAENERMHLMIVMALRNMGPALRTIIFAAQMGIVPFYAIGYFFSPKFCHSFVGYLEEEAVKTYTSVLDLIDAGKLPKFETNAHVAAKNYYHLPAGATMRDVITNIRADEAHHRELNHCLAHLTKKECNPFPPGY